MLRDRGENSLDLCGFPGRKTVQPIQITFSLKNGVLLRNKTIAAPTQIRGAVSLFRLSAPRSFIYIICPSYLIASSPLWRITSIGSFILYQQGKSCVVNFPFSLAKQTHGCFLSCGFPTVIKPNPSIYWISLTSPTIFLMIEELKMYTKLFHLIFVK